MTGKKGLIIFIFKKGNKEGPGKYHPVRLTSVLGKIMEYVKGRHGSDQR